MRTPAWAGAGHRYPAGIPSGDPHEFTLTFYLARGVSEAVDVGLASDDSYGQWDESRTLTIKSSKLPDGSLTRTISAGGIDDARVSSQFAGAVIDRLRESKDVHFLSLDADRAYPRKKMNVNEMAQAYETDWNRPEHTKGQSFRPTSTLYGEWLKYCLATENQASTRFVRQIRQARMANRDDPTFTDHFAPYKTALSTVLPHVTFTGVDSQDRALLFDTADLDLSYDQLSGGEREIAFLLGQIDRFQLRQGLLLLDEPELHLNADLIRTWVKYLVSTVRQGQIWLATHSLEAVEAAGQEATFVLERSELVRRVDKANRLDDRPLLATLARSVGTPAFSISKLRFVFVEGEERLGERERFRRLVGVDEDTRYIECGSCNEVTRRVSAVKSVAGAAGELIRVGGVVDRDLRTDGEVCEMAGDGSVFVLSVHEVENLYLEPGLVDALLRQNGNTEIAAEELIRDGADERSGAWIFQWWSRMLDDKRLNEAARRAKDAVKALTWSEIDRDRAGLVERMSIAAGAEGQEKTKLERRLRIAIDSYEKQRSDTNLWKRCEGKQVLAFVATRVGFAGASNYERAAQRAWDDGEVPRPEALEELRGFVSGCSN